MCRIGILDKNGTEVVKYTYDAWGNHTVSGSKASTIGNLNPFRYRSYFYDTETGLYFLQTRYYDPEAGRFLNMDSVQYADPEATNGLNLYVYCGNNPVMNVDPTGHIVIQFIVSLVCYVGAAVASIWDKDIRSDMNAIDWNPFNTDETAVINSQKVSFYKGAPVFRTSQGRSGTFCAIFLSANADETTLKHEIRSYCPATYFRPCKLCTNDWFTVMVTVEQKELL